MSRPWQPALSPNAWLRWEAVASRLPAGAETVLEVGCGRGGFAVRLAERYQYLGIEPDATAAAVASRRLAAAGVGGEVRVGDLCAVEHAAVFDLVCAFEVIEHIEDDQSFVADCAARVAPNGTLVLTTPAGEDRFGAADRMVGHFRRYDPPGLTVLLESAGLKEVDVVPYGAPFGYVLESVRDLIATARSRRTAALSIEERTAASGRLLQPGDGAIGAAIWAAMLPMRALQRALSGRGPSLLATGRRAVASTT